jgi:hypothetical protein
MLPLLSRKRLLPHLFNAHTPSHFEWTNLHLCNSNRLL